MLFLLSYVLIYLAAPVVYVGVVQAALCQKLGAGAVVANLPSATYLLGGFAPLIVSLLVPHRWERAVAVWSFGLGAIFTGMVALSLVQDFGSGVQIAVVTVQGLLQGFAVTTSQVFVMQCLGRGTTLEARSRIFKRTFALTPVFAVIGSLAAQAILTGQLRFVQYPYDFALLYVIGFLCLAGVTLCTKLYQLAPIPDEPRPPIVRYLVESVRGYVGSQPLLLLFLAYLLWNCSLAATSNFSLYTKEALGRDPKEFSGLIMAIRFGCKAIGGYFLGVLAVRFGLRVSVMATILLLAAGSLWAWVTPGYIYLLAFGFLGAGELGGAYIPNYGVAISSPQEAARYLSLLTLASPAASFAPALHGALTDRFGFPGSFAFGLLSALVALWLTVKIRDPLRGR